VAHSDNAAQQHIEETYSSDASGTVTVTIANLTSGYRRQYQLGRWASHGTPHVAAPQRSKPRRRKSAEDNEAKMKRETPHR
jgi:hypothetical protein